MLDSRGVDDGALSWSRQEVMEIAARWNRWPWKWVELLPF